VCCTERRLFRGQGVEEEAMVYPKIEWRILKAMHGKTRSEDNPEFEMRRAAIHAATSANASHAFVTWRRAHGPVERI
jgi:hypothetical protein